jgi:hypothetical protein
MQSTASPTPTPDYCAMPDGTPAYDVLLDYQDDWDAQWALVFQTPRNQLAAQIGVLQDTRQELGREDWAQCARTAQALLGRYMDKLIEGATDFLGTGSAATLAGLLELAERDLELFRDALQEIKPD